MLFLDCDVKQIVFSSACVTYGIPKHLPIDHSKHDSSGAGLHAGITVFGTDFPSSDGTAVRDYVQVTDLADAHVRPTGYLEAGGENASFNLGNGLGYCLRDMIRCVERMTRARVSVVEDARRPAILQH